jgi:hypothetical protein
VPRVVIFRYSQIYFAKSDAREVIEKNSRKLLNQSRFCQFLSFSGLFIKILDSRVVDKKELRSKPKAVFKLYLVCPPDCVSFFLFPHFLRRRAKAELPARQTGTTFFFRAIKRTLGGPEAAMIRGLSAVAKWCLSK